MKEKSEDRNEGRSKVKQELDTPGKIMVTGIPKKESYVVADLEKEFAPYGRITEVNIIRDKRTNIPRGFAFITYENPQDSEDAIKAMNGKDLGGESEVHCEQAVIGFRKSRMINDDGRGWRGAPRGRGARSFDRPGRGIERGRSRGSDRAKGMFNRGARGGMYRGRGRFEGGMGRMYEEEYCEEYYEPETGYEYPHRVDRRGPHQRGYAHGRGGPNDQGGPIMRGGRKVLLPDPPARGQGGRSYHGSSRAPPLDEEYYEDDANGYQSRDYFNESGEPYTEGYEEPFAEEVEYPSEGYHAREQPRGRGPVAPHARSAPSREVYEPRAPSRRQTEDFGYSSEDIHQRSQAGPPKVQRRSGPVYNEEMYDEDSEPLSSADLYGLGGGRQALSSLTGGPSARLGRTATINRGGTAPVRRAALPETDPYSQESHGMYNRTVPQGVAMKVAAASEFEEDLYGDLYMRRAVSAVSSRQGGSSRARTALLSSDVYVPDRVQPKAALLGGESVPTRRVKATGPSSRYVDDYQDTGPLAAPSRDAYAEPRRPAARRTEADYRMREDPYQRVVSETDGYVSYPTSLRVPAESISSDLFSRKRLIDQYGDADLSAHAGLSTRREYGDYRPAAVVPAKRERVERGADRAVYDNYASRLEGTYRGL